MTTTAEERHKKYGDAPDPAFRERIDILIERVGGPTELAKKSGLSRAVIDKYKNGESDPSRARLMALAEAGAVSIKWLVSGEGNPEDSDEENTSFVLLPVMNAMASAGGGAASLTEHQTGIIKFDRAWLYNTWHLNPNDLFTMPTMGESMEPTIKAGEYLLASRAEDHLKPGDGIYIIRLDGHILVKRLQILPGGKLVISSDNAAYQPYEIALNDGVDFAILGKVVLVHGVRRV